MLNDSAEVLDGYYNVKLVFDINLVEFIRFDGD
jgi:hypothetical protein